MASSPETPEKWFANVAQVAISFEPTAAEAGNAPGAFVLKGNCVKVW